MPQTSCLTPLGDLTLSEDDGAIVAMDWGRGRDQQPTTLLQEAVRQLQAYFNGELAAFDLPLNPHGTAFQRRVWQWVREIPYGAVENYGAIAHEIGSSPRPVGMACGRNPIPILIPCHRVLASQGLGGYSGGDGLQTKIALLRLEGAPISKGNKR